jgi:hypothetical protein
MRQRVSTFQLSCNVARGRPIERTALPPICASPANTCSTRARVSAMRWLRRRCVSAIGLLAAGAWCCPIDLWRQGDKVDVLLHHPQRVAKLVQLSSRSRSANRLVLIMRNYVRFEAPPSCQTGKGFSRCLKLPKTRVDQDVAPGPNTGREILLTPLDEDQPGGVAAVIR